MINGEIFKDTIQLYTKKVQITCVFHNKAPNFKSQILLTKIQFKIPIVSIHSSKLKHNQTRIKRVREGVVWTDQRCSQLTKYQPQWSNAWSQGEPQALYTTE